MLEYQSKFVGNSHKKSDSGPIMATIISMTLKIASI